MATKTATQAAAKKPAAKKAVKKETKTAVATKKNPAVKKPTRKVNLASLHSTESGARTKPILSNASLNFRVRAYRAFHQNMKFVGRYKAATNGKSQKFAMLGSHDGNPFTVTISEKPACSCLDFRKSANVCKHMIFIFHYVLGVPKTSPLLAQDSFSPSEVEDLLESARQTIVKKKYRTSANERTLHCAKGQTFEEELEAKPKKKAAVSRNKGDDCAVCFEPLKRSISTCVKCNNSVHEKCWREYKTSHGGKNECMLCRGKFENEFDDDDDETDDESGLNFDGEVRRIADYDKNNFQFRSRGGGGGFGGGGYNRWYGGGGGYNRNYPFGRMFF